MTEYQGKCWNEQWEMPDVLVRCVISLYEGATIMVRVDSELSEECKVNVGMHQGSVPSSFDRVPRKVLE